MLNVKIQNLEMNCQISFKFSENPTQVVTLEAGGKPSTIIFAALRWGPPAHASRGAPRGCINSAGPTERVRAYLGRQGNAIIDAAAATASTSLEAAVSSHSVTVVLSQGRKPSDPQYTIPH